MKKFVSLLVCFALGCAVLAGCSKEIDDSETNLIISLYEGGYGTSAFQKIADKFEEHYAEEGYTVTIIEDPALVSSTVISKIQSGPKVTPTDLFLPGDVQFRQIISQGDKFIKGYEYGLEDLTDLFGQKVYGEDVTYAEKLDPQYAEGSAIEIDGETRYFSVPFMGGISGLAYNNELFEANGWKLPNTTNELITLIEEIKEDGATPFVWSSGKGYWDYCVYPWWRQLVTDEEAEDFWNCVDKNGDVSAEVFHSQALLTAFTALEDCIYDTKNSHPKSMTFTHIEAQMAMYETSNRIAMMPTGDWLENEMKNSGYEPGQIDIGLMKVPVISDVIYTYDSIGNPQYKYQTIQSDEKLSEVITAIDTNASKPADVSQEDFDAITKIRSYTNSNGFMFNAMIPVYSNAKKVAKEFLLYMASDEAQQIFFNETGALLPYSTANLQKPANPTRLQKAVLDSLGKTTYISNRAPKNPIFYNTDLESWHINIEGYIGTTEKADKMTAKQFWDWNYDEYSSNFDLYLSMAQQ